MRLILHDVQMDQTLNLNGRIGHSKAEHRLRLRLLILHDIQLYKKIKTYRKVYTCLHFKDKIKLCQTLHLKFF